jgi:hypothetical protein
VGFCCEGGGVSIIFRYEGQCENIVPLFLSDNVVLVIIFHLDFSHNVFREIN